MSYVELASQGLVGLVFAASAFSKLSGRSAFRRFASWLMELPVPLVRHRLTAPTVVATEVLIVGLLIIPWTRQAGSALAALALAVFAAGTLLAVRRGVRTQCQCFGASPSRLNVRHAIRDMLLCVVACLGAVSVSSSTAHPAGIAISLGVGVAAALFVVFLDDVAALVAAVAGGDD